MTFIKKHKATILAFLIPFIAIILVLNVLLPKATPRLKRVDTKASAMKEIVHFVAIGDSLTEGIGDTTLSGGFVPLLKKGLLDEEEVNTLDAQNFGKSGDRSDQIIKRINKSEDIQKGLANADFITLTVGGNDLMKVVKKELLNNIDVHTFDKPKKKYEKQLKELYDVIRTYNAKAPIYQLGIYNPFYVNFQDVKEMQDIVMLWDGVAENVVTDEKHAYFVPINDQLYKGSQDGESVIGNGEKKEKTNETSASSEAESPVNNLISDIDNFHPNNLGYQIIANSFKEALMDTTKEWLKK